MAKKSTKDLWEGELYGPIDTRAIQPYEALKNYICPGCNQDIPSGTGHTVAVPQQAPDLRRHWHHRCWQRRSTSSLA